MISFAEEVRSDLLRQVWAFVGEPARVEFQSPGKRENKETHAGRIASVYPNGFLLDGGEIGGRAFFSYVDLFAGHARIVGGPADLAVGHAVARLRQKLVRLAPGKAPREQLAALLA